MFGITVDSDENVGRLRDYIKKKNTKHTILWDGEEEAHTLYDVSGIPATYVIDKQGRIMRWPAEDGTGIGDEVHLGFGPGQEKVIEAMVKKALAEK